MFTDPRDIQCYLCVMNKVIHLFVYLIRLDIKNQSALAGVLLFGLSSIYSAYLMNPSVLDGQFLITFWLLAILFASFYTIQKEDGGQNKGGQLFLYMMVSPRMYISIKSIYTGLFLVAVNLLQWGLLLFFFGSDWIIQSNAALVIWAIVLISFALGITLSFVHGISIKTRQPGGILAILGFATLIPILFSAVILMKTLTLTPNSGEVDWGWMLISMMILLPFALSNVLYPYLWRD